MDFPLHAHITVVFLLLIPLLVSRGVVQGTQPGAFCIPDGWQSGRAITLSVTNNTAKPTVIRSMGDVIYSTSLKKMLIDDFTFSAERKLTKIFDYPGKVLYTIYNEEINNTSVPTCIRSALLRPFQPICVPENASMTQIKSYFGLTPDVEFFFEFSGKTNGTNYRISQSMDYQTPLFLEMWGRHDEEWFFRTEEFYNSTIWGSMPDNIFTPPVFCNHVALTEMPPGNTQSLAEQLSQVFLPV